MKTTTWKLQLTLLLVSSLTIMSVITISPALPQMAKEFSSVPNSAVLVKLVLTIPALLIAVFSPITGTIIDKYGRLQVLRLSLVLFAVSGVSGFFLDNVYAILLSRSVLGISVGMSMPIVITLIADYFDGMKRQQFVGLQIAFMSLGGIVFISLGGVLADKGWHYPFLIYLFSLLVLSFAIRYLREPVLQYKKTAHGQLQSHYLIWLLCLNTMVMWIIFFLIPVQIPFYLKSIGIEKNSLSGAAIATSTAFSAVSSFAFAGIKKRFNFLFIFSMGYLLMATGYMCIAFSASYFMVIVAMIFLGLGMGMMIPNTNMWIMKIALPQQRGREIGKLTTFWFFGQFISPIITYPILQHLTLSSAFLLTALISLFISLAFMIFHFSKTGKSALEFQPLMS